MILIILNYISPVLFLIKCTINDFINSSGKYPCDNMLVYNIDRYTVYTNASVGKYEMLCSQAVIGLCREIAIAIQKESGDSDGGNVWYVTMRITFNIPEFTRNERNSHCGVLHIAPVRVANLVLDDAIAAIQTSR